MSTTGALRTRSIKEVDPPRPLKTSSKNSSTEVVKSDNRIEKTMLLMNAVVNSIGNELFDETLMNNIIALCSDLKIYGHLIDNPIYQSQLDEYFISFREATMRSELSFSARLHLLEVIELREQKWKRNVSNFHAYYQSRGDDMSMVNVSKNDESSLSSLIEATLPYQTSDLVKRSGRYSKPVRLPGKNYCKDEIVIRNSDSGKVMGIKGRRVHMIEQLSETIISFQRVQPTSKERLVQITGPTEDNIKYATCLIGETIRSNTSPITDFTGSNCSLSSVELEEADHRKISKVPVCNDLKDECTYKHKVLVNGYELMITGNNYSYVSIAKNVLDDFFGRCTLGLESPIIEGNNRDMRFDLTNIVGGDGYGIYRSVELLNSPTTPNRESVFPLEPVLSLGGSNMNYIGAAPATTEKSSVRYKYSKELLMELGESPLCHKKPFDWERISEQLPQIMTK